MASLISYLQLEDGDIICYQKNPYVMSDVRHRYQDIPTFLEYVNNRQVPIIYIILLTGICLYYLFYCKLPYGRTAFCIVLFIVKHNLFLLIILLIQIYKPCIAVYLMEREGVVCLLPPGKC